MTTDLTGCFLGYDPGGKNGHGVAAILVESGSIKTHWLTTKSTAVDAANWLNEVGNLRHALGVGVDTLAYWSGGHAGWRAADHGLRRGYKKVAGSVLSPNRLQGSMALNGMFVLRRLRDADRSLYVTETHPKVLHFAMTGRPYREGREEGLAVWLEGIRTTWLKQMGLCQQENQPETETRYPVNDHELDAVVSAYAAFRGHVASFGGQGGWDLNLCLANDCEELVRRLGEGDAGETWSEPAESLEFPADDAGGAGRTEYRWPSPGGVDHFGN